MVPNRIGRYEIKRELGRGGMATVFLADDPRFQREVAIKLLPREFLHNQQFRGRFEREARTIASLEHPAIVPVHDFGEENGQPYIVMRHMSGGSLGGRLQNGPLSLADTTRILQRLAPALDYAHGRGIIHRDLKPDNILFDQWHNPYLSDFGIVKLVQTSQAALTATGSQIGTPAYMSPEQIKGEALDGRSDIYTLGVIAFQLLAGQLPYSGQSQHSFLFKHVYEPTPQIQAVNPALPPTCQAMLERAMAKEPSDRYPTATAFVAALASLAGDNVPTRLDQSLRLVQSPPVAPDLPTQMDTPPDVELPNKPSRSLRPGRFAWSANWLYAAGGGGALLFIGLIAFIAIIVALMGRNNAGETSQTQPTATPATTQTVALAPATPTPRASATPTNTPLPTPTTTPTPQPTHTPTATPTSTATPTLDPNIPPPNASLSDRWTRPADGMVMVYVPSGTFLMGSDPDEDPDAQEDEFPQHEVTLDGYWFDHTEVTNAHFATFVDETSYITTAEEAGSSWVRTGTEWVFTEGAYWNNPQGDGGRALSQHPVVHVSWLDATAYCGWVEGGLPTEAQWEYAARGSAGSIYPWGDAFDDTRLNYCDTNCPFDWRDSGADDGYAFTAPVGTYPSGESWVGALDMAGNVWEWVNDWYDEDYYTDAPPENPTGPTDGTRRVLRGGGWNNIASNVRAANRNVDNPSLSFGGIGFRCVAVPGIR